MYVSPGNVPFLLADTLVSINGQPRSCSSLPSTVNESSRSVDDEIPLARKLYILSNYTAIAVAGTEVSISDFLQTVKGLIGIFELDERPMRRVGDLANQYTNLEVIGAYVCRTTDGGWSNNILSPRGTIEITNYNICAYAGSGGGEMSVMVEEYGSGLTGARIVNPYELMRGTVGALNNHKIKKEVFQLDNDSSWGGYIECLMFDVNEFCWRRTFRSMHFFATVSENDPRSLLMAFEQKYICYDPGDKHGRFMVLDLRGTTFRYEWVFYDLLNPSHTCMYSSDFWRSWRPETATITAIKHDTDAFVTKTLNLDEMSDVIFELDAGVIHAGLKDSFFRKFAAETLSFWR